MRHKRERELFKRFTRTAYHTQDTVLNDGTVNFFVIELQLEKHSR